jgi:hypothetical protein
MKTSDKHDDHYDVKCKSGRRFTLRMLSGYDHVIADRAAKDVMAMPAYRMGMAIVAVDGHKVDVARNDLDLMARLQEIKARESDELLRAFGNQYEKAPQRKFELRELNTLEQSNADRAAGDFMVLAAYRAIASVTKIDDRSVRDVENEADLVARLKEVTGPEMNTIVFEYGKNFAGLTDEDLGNGFELDESPPT